MKRWSGFVLALAVSASSALACGGSANGGGNGSGTAAGSTATSCATSTQKAVDAAKVPIKTAVPTEKVAATAQKGKSVWFISPSQATGYALGVSQGVQAAGAAAGLDVHIFDGKGQPTLYNEGINQAVAAKAAAIIAYAIDPGLISQALPQAAAAGIPVISAMTGQPATTGVYASVNPDVAGLGRLQADAALVATKCKLNGGIVYASNFTILSAMKEAATAEVQKQCASCSLTDLNVQLPTIATQLGPLTTSTMARLPNLNVLIATFDQAAVYMVPAIERAQNPGVAVVGANGNAANLDFIRQGRVQVADAAYPPAAYLGWQLFDQGLRGMAKMSPAKVTVQVQMFDKSNVGAAGATEATTFPGLTGYQAAFSKAWGI